MPNIDFTIASSVPWYDEGFEMWRTLVSRIVAWAGDDSNRLVIRTGGNRPILRVPSELCADHGPLTLTEGGTDQCADVTEDKFVAVTAVDPPPAPGPDAPTGLTIGTATDTTLPVSWTAVEGATGYEVRWAPSGTTTWTVRPSVTTTSDTITGLTASTAYDVQVRVTTADGTSAWSATITGSTTAAPAQQLPAPTGLAASGQTTTTMDVTWTAVANADGYVVEYRTPAGTGTWTAAPSVVDATATLTGLTAATEYEIRVTATGDGNTWTDSDPSTAITASTTAAALAESATVKTTRTRKS